MNGTGRVRALALYLFSFASGAAALAYQVVWGKQLALSFGGTTLAVSAVVAGFLGGMGLGAAIVPIGIRRMRSTLAAYAGLEAGIALSAFLLTSVLWRLPSFVASLALDGAPLTAARFALAFALLTIPAILMGATFPVLADALIRSRDELGRHLGWLYGLNTLGAAAGTLLTGFVLIERLGLDATVHAANVVNLAVALGAAALAGFGGRRESAPLPSDVFDPPRVPGGLIATVLTLSGFATLAYEILWFRSLTYLFGNSTYAFTTMLFVFLTGLALGPLVYRRFAGKSPERTLAYTQLGIGLFAVIAIAAVATVVADAELSTRLSVFSPEIFDRPWRSRVARHLGFASAVMLPGTFLMGLAFPLAAALRVADPRRVGARLGSSVLLANVGSIFGSVIAATWLLPHLGTVGGTRLVAALNVGLGFAILFVLRERGRSLATAVMLAVAGGIVVAVTPGHIRFASAAAGVPGADAVFEEEGDLATVQVWQDPVRPDRLGMAIDGSIIGATRTWPSIVWTKQVLIAHVAMLWRDAETALTIGLGSASTVQALTTWPDLRSIDVVEINEPVVHGASFFPESAALDDPRVSLRVDDAIQFLAGTDRQWDRIVSDGKQAISFSGTSKFLSHEFYSFARERLTDRGLFVQWVPVAVGNFEFQVIVRTFLEVFPETEVFLEPPNHLVFVGAKTSFDDLAIRTALPPAALENLRTANIRSIHALGARWVASGSALGPLIPKGPRHDWNHPVLEFAAYRLTPAEWRASAGEVLALLVRASGTPSLSGYILAPAGENVADVARLVRVSCAFAAVGQAERARDFASQALLIDPGDPAAVAWAERLERPLSSPVRE
ncbi:MAG: fused MFS/spermidine synthase [bacterium]